MKNEKQNEEDAEAKAYEEYRKYQKRVFFECLQDAKAEEELKKVCYAHATSPAEYEETLTVKVIDVAIAFFALRCKHSHYWINGVKSEEIKK